MRARYEAWLRNRGMARNTVRTYGGFIETVPADTLNDADALLTFARTVLRDCPVGTFLPRHAALAWWLHFRHDMPIEEARHRLPSVRAARGSALRDSLSEEQLTLFLRAVDGEPRPAVRAVLRLLPLTGARVSEMCQRRIGDLRVQDGRRALVVPAEESKNGEARALPLTSRAQAVLDTYLASEHSRADDPSAWLFPGRDDHISPATVQRSCRRIRAACPDLGNLTPHVLRHTFGTLAVQKGVNLRIVQQAMGHASVKTTERYTHPTHRDVADALEVL